MFCNQCGAKLADGVKFCPECGAPIANAAPSVSAKEDNAVNYRSAVAQPPVQPQPHPAPSYGAAQPQPQARSASPAYGAAQPGGYAPPQGQAAAVPQAQPNGYAQGQPGYSQPQGQLGYSQPQGQPGYPYAGQAPSYGAKPKKSRAGVIVLAALLVLALLVGVLIFVFIKLRYEEPPLPALTEPAVTEEAVTEAAATEAASAPATTEAAPGITEKATEAASASASNDTALSDAEATEAMERLTGYWNTDDGTQFIGVTRLEGGLYYFTAGYWYSEPTLIGYLMQPVRGDLSGTVTMRLYYEGFEGETYSIPSLDEEVTFDLSEAFDGTLTWSCAGLRQTLRFAGNTMEEAMPPM